VPHLPAAGKVVSLSPSSPERIDVAVGIDGIAGPPFG